MINLIALLWSIGLVTCAPRLTYRFEQTIESRQTQNYAIFSPDSSKLILLQQNCFTVYGYEQTSFVKMQTVKLGFSIVDVAWSSDSKTMAIRYFTNINVYTEHQGKYVLTQEIALDDLMNGFRMGLHICEDENYMLSAMDSRIDIYKKNQNKYDLLKSFNRSGLQTKISASKNCSRILVSDSNKTQILYFQQEQITHSFLLFPSQSKRVLKMSSDGHLVVAENKDILLMWEESGSSFSYNRRSMRLHINSSETALSFSDEFDAVAILTGQQVGVYERIDESYYLTYTKKQNLVHQFTMSPDRLRLAVSEIVQNGKQLTKIYSLAMFSTANMWGDKQQFANKITIGCIIGIIILFVFTIVYLFIKECTPRRGYSSPGYPTRLN